MSKHIYFTLILSLFLPFISQATITVWAIKGDVFIDNKSANPTMVLDKQSEIIMANEKSYVCLFDSENNKLLEFAGIKRLNYSTIIELFKSEPVLPKLKEYSIHDNAAIKDTSKGQPSRQYYDIFPNDRYQQHRTFVIGEKDTIKAKIKRDNSVAEDAHWRVFSLQNKNDIPLHFEQLKNINEVKLNVPIQKLDTSKFVTFDPNNKDTLCILIATFMTEQEKGSLNFNFSYDMSILVLKESAIEKKREPLSVIAPKKGPGHQMYAILWALEHELIFDAQEIFYGIDNKALDYPGFIELYKHWKHTIEGDYKYRPLDYILKE